jgi:hypothetical protein
VDAVKGLQAAVGIRSISSNTYDYTEHLEVPGSALIYQTTQAITDIAGTFDATPVPAIYYDGS